MALPFPWGDMFALQRRNVVNALLETCLFGVIYPCDSDQGIVPYTHM